MNKVIGILGWILFYLGLVILSAYMGLIWAEGLFGQEMSCNLLINQNTTRCFGK